jgi:biopolymer transport protein ExbD
MNFYQKKRRTPVLQIINMIDILIILLIFLVVSTTFKDSRKARVAGAAARSVLNVAIPVSEAMNLGTDTAARVSLTVTREEKCYLADVEIPLSQLGDSLRVFKESSPDSKLDLRIDEKVSFGSLIRIWDGLTKAGYKVGDVPARVLRAGTGG